MTDAEQIAYEDRLLSEAQAQAYADAKLSEQAQAFELWEDLGEVDADAEITEPEFTIYDASGIGCIPLGDIQAVKAKSKNGKSFFCAIVCASVLGCDEFFRTAGNVRTAFYFDTEQNQANTILLKRRVCRMLKWDEHTNTPNFRVFNLRERTCDERMTAIDTAISYHAIMGTPKPDLVVIDGIADINHNFNDLTECESTINHLMKLSKENDCAIVCVLHENKSKDDNGMKGHLGTLLLQKSSDVFQVTKDRGEASFTVEHTDSRNRAIAPFRFYLDESATPKRSSSDVVTKQEAKTEQKNVKNFGRMQEAFQSSGKDALTRTELCQILMLKGICKRTADDWITSAKTMGIIAKTADDKYKLT